ncbi:phage tail family protein [Staphylococcus nepalensis]|nr:phage tail family protein [Staphylococcus nepalensis]
MYDPNMNELKYPEGVRPLDLLVSSIEKERKEQAIDGIPGVIDYGYNLKGREIKMNFMTEHYHDTYDHRLQRDEIYNLFDSYPYLYVSDNTVPSRVLKITIDGSFTPERYGYWYSTFEVDARISNLPYWRTKYTTQDIETNGYSGLVEKFGTADGINVDRTKYTFTETSFKVWNGGNVTVDPRNMMLYIKMFYVKGTGSITNKTTGEKLNIINDWKGNHLTIEGVKIIKATNVNGLRDTNRKFISLVPGNNEIEIKGLEFTKISFDFPYYYK